jgi:hypothetical protein
MGSCGPLLPALVKTGKWKRKTVIKHSQTQVQDVNFFIFNSIATVSVMVDIIMFSGGICYGSLSFISSRLELFVVLLKV